MNKNLKVLPSGFSKMCHSERKAFVIQFFNHCKCCTEIGPNQLLELPKICKPLFLASLMNSRLHFHNYLSSPWCNMEYLKLQKSTVALVDLGIS